MTMYRTLIVIFDSSVFSKELAAIRKDPALQAAIVANQAAELSKASTLSALPWPDATCVAVVLALSVLEALFLEDTVKAWANNNPGFLESVEACGDALLLWVPPADLGPVAVDLHHAALAAAVHLLSIRKPTAQLHRNAPPMTLGYLQTAAAAAGMLLQQGAQGLLDLKALGDLGFLLASFLRQEGLINGEGEWTEKVLDLSAPGRSLEALQVADGLVRLPSCQQP